MKVLEHKVETWVFFANYTRIPAIIHSKKNLNHELISNNCFDVKIVLIGINFL